MERLNRAFDGIRNFIVGFIYVAEAVGFIDDNQVPGSLAHIRVFGFDELIGANNDFVLVKRVQIAFFDLLIECLALQNHRGQEEFISQLLAPLFA